MTPQEIQSLLPFLANDTLTGEDRGAVEAAVAADTGLQSELAALRAIRSTMQAEEGFSPGEMGLARLLRDAGEQKVAARPAARPLLWQVAAAVLLAVVLGQGFLMTRQSDPGGYQLAGSDAAISIAIAPDATEAQFREMLLSAGAEIISGPSALGFYELKIAEGATLAEVHAILEASDIVENITPPPE